MTVQNAPFLSFQKIWEDNDIIELVVTVHDGKSTFSINVYAGHDQVKEVFDKLEVFKSQIRGGLIDVAFGEFGPEFAYGAFHARLHFANDQRGRILISLRMQSTFFDFGQKNVASEAEMYLVTEPGLLDDFIRSFSHLDEGSRTKAELECVGRD
jgi:hypothetical protein